MVRYLINVIVTKDENTVQHTNEVPYVSDIPQRADNVQLEYWHDQTTVVTYLQIILYSRI